MPSQYPVDGVTVFFLPDRSQNPTTLHTIAPCRGRTFSDCRHSAHHRHLQRPNVLRLPPFCPPSPLSEADRSQMPTILHTIAPCRGRTFSDCRHSAHHRHFQRPTVLKWPGICTSSNLNTAAGAFTAPCGRGDGILLARPFSNGRHSAHHRHSHRPNVLKTPGVAHVPN